ncbi:hypothetical protein PAXRUDRAFT_137440 [Paxillus rubicundulus Ve08.2h10]|uniref:Uncharacterized protein n=1 Tax=Paxillus rubicundulus Ve08.2h10 TaxID=930991 RepID=A0A0D0DGB5_9AGAM|nr:hypothetical protein PAXRUDRAFT_137440 [Paxillus rubicundulus Ve08.2h10]
MSIPIYFLCHGLIPHPGNMPQQWSTLNPVILIIILTPLYILQGNISPEVVYPKPCHLLHICTHTATQSYPNFQIHFYFYFYLCFYLKNHNTLSIIHKSRVKTHAVG